MRHACSNRNPWLRPSPSLPRPSPSASNPPASDRRLRSCCRRLRHKIASRMGYVRAMVVARGKTARDETVQVAAQTGGKEIAEAA